MVIYKFVTKQHKKEQKRKVKLSTKYFLPLLNVSDVYITKEGKRQLGAVIGTNVSKNLISLTKSELGLLKLIA